MKESFECGKYRSGLSAILYLWLIAFFLDDLEEAELILNKCLEKWPTGSLYSYLGGYISRRRTEVQLSLTRFQNVKKWSDELPILQIISNYEIGWCHYLLGNYSDAIIKFEEFLSEYTSPSFVAFCAFQLGLCYFFSDKLDEAKTSWSKVENFTRVNFSYDEFANRKSKQYVNSGMSKIERACLLAYNQRKIGKYEKAVELLESVKYLVVVEDGSVVVDTSSAQQGAEDQAYWYYVYATVYKKMRNSYEAKTKFETVIAMKSSVQTEAYIVAWAYYNLSLIEIEDGDLDKAKVYAKQSSDSNSRDFDKPLERKLKSLQDMLEK
jgi:tetratricopeptide (TPR) repeat protein